LRRRISRDPPGRRSRNLTPERAYRSDDCGTRFPPDVNQERARPDPEAAIPSFVKTGTAFRRLGGRGGGPRSMTTGGFHARRLVRQFLFRSTISRAFVRASPSYKWRGLQQGGLSQ